MRTIRLSRGRYTLVDAEDYERLNRYRWYWNPPKHRGAGWGYAFRKGRKKHGEPSTVMMHREIMGFSDGVCIDHINRNGLDNRKQNLRFADHQKNGFNRGKSRICLYTSRFKGVFRRTGAIKWTARIKFNGRHVELGTYREEEKAAAVYNFAARLFFGRYRCENPHVPELTLSEQWRIFGIAKRYVERYGWYVDTETYRSFFMQAAS